MSESHVIALRFRPKTFGQVVGQEAITRTLGNAIKSNSLHHAYLFAGARGVGKTTTARILAKSLNCVNAPTTDPCGECPSCLDIAGSRSLYVAELDAASNTGIDNVREVIITSAAFSPPPGQYRIFIIDEVHQLSTASFNALLKTIEEPPPRVIFIMATTEIQKVPDTILSRCQVFEFRTIQLNKIAGELKRIAGEIGITISDSALSMIARAGEGSMRDAESALDQVISFADGAITDEDVSAALGLVSLEVMSSTLRAVAEQDSKELLTIVDDVVSRGLDLRNFCRDLMGYVRSLLVIKAVGADTELTQIPRSEAQALEGVASEFSEPDLIRFFSILSKTEQDIRLSSQQRFQLEIGLVKMAQVSRLYSVEEALERLTALEARLSGQNPANQSLPSSAQAKMTANIDRGSARGVAELTDRNLGAGERRVDLRPPRATSSGALQPSGPSAPPGPSPSFSRSGPSVSKAPPEPPPLFEEPPDELPDVPPVWQSGAADQAVPAGIAESIKQALLSRRKMIIVSTLDQAESILVDGDYLKVAYSQPNSIFKAKLEARDSRTIIEEVCREIAGRQLVLSVSIAGAAASAGPGRVVPPERSKARIGEGPASQAVAPRGSMASDGANDSLGRPGSIAEGPEDTSLKNDPQQPENHPAVRALVEKFQGEVIDVTKPRS
jgi:DNA polymerase-3 subunit gamma/tau